MNLGAVGERAEVADGDARAAESPESTSCPSSVRAPRRTTRRSTVSLPLMTNTVPVSPFACTASVGITHGLRRPGARIRFGFAGSR